MAMELFRVLINQEWTADTEALVWAPNGAEAELLAKRNVDIDILDASSCFIFGHAKPEPLDAGVIDRMDDCLWLILPDGEVCENSRTGLAKFKSFFDPERLEAIRLARIEANNGQMPLPLNQS